MQLRAVAWSALATGAVQVQLVFLSRDPRCEVGDVLSHGDWAGALGVLPGGGGGLSPPHRIPVGGSVEGRWKGGRLALAHSLYA